MITRCIFCGRTDLSREHVWPVWSHQYLSKAAKTGRFIKKQIVTSAKNPRISGVRQLKEQAGDVTTMKLKVVCRNHCNNGWMSRLENKVWPVLIPLITGTGLSLERDRQELLANWIAMKFLTCEMSQPDDLVTSDLERSLFMGRRAPPESMTIWIGRYVGGSWQSAYLRHAATIGWAPAGTYPKVPPSGSFEKNTQSRSLVIGELYVHAISTTVPKLRASNATGCR